MPKSRPFLYRVMSNSSVSMKLKFSHSYLLYAGINVLFMLKYSTRISLTEGYLLTVGYAVLLSLFPWVFAKLKVSPTVYRYGFFAVGLVFFIFSMVLNSTVDGASLQVDRWSAMEVGIEALLHGEYPYAAVDNLGGRTSNLPGLIGIGIPFYLLGNVGYLQSFCFILFTYGCYRVFDQYKTRLFCLLLLVLSPAYVWEVYVKSDLMSNFILILLFVIWVYQRTVAQKKIKLSLLSFVATSLLLTRIIAFIPISIVLVKPFFSWSMQRKIYFLGISLLTIVAGGYLCFHQAESMAYIKKYNPFELQNRQLPTLLSALFLVIPLYFADKVSHLNSVFKAIVIGLFLPIMAAFIGKLYRYGFHQSVFESGFDLSYFNMLMPFLLVLLSLQFTQKQASN